MKRQSPRYIMRWIGCILFLFSTRVMSDAVIERDPTQPDARLFSQKNATPTQAAETQAYQLQSIIIRKTKRIALINDNLVTIGDSVGNAKVIEIDKNAVILSESGKKTTIYLFDNRIWK